MKYLNPKIEKVLQVLLPLQVLYASGDYTPTPINLTIAIINVVLLISNLFILFKYGKETQKHFI